MPRHAADTGAMRALTAFAAALVILSAGAFALGARAPAGPAGPTPRGAVGARTESAGGERLPFRTGVRTVRSAETYPVAGETAEALLRALLAAGPKTEDGAYFGLTTAETDVRYQTVESAGGCRIDGVEVDLRVVVTLPAWDPPPGASQPLRRDWGQFLAALRRHEDEHGAIAERSAAVLYRSVSEVRRPTCDAAVAAGRQLVGRLQAEGEAAHRRFDEATDHGRTQGAAWPLP